MLASLKAKNHFSSEFIVKFNVISRKVSDAYDWVRLVICRLSERRCKSVPRNLHVAVVVNARLFAVTSKIAFYSFSRSALCAHSAVRENRFFLLLSQKKLVKTAGIFSDCITVCIEERMKSSLQPKNRNDERFGKRLWVFKYAQMVLRDISEYIRCQPSRDLLLVETREGKLQI